MQPVQPMVASPSRAEPIIIEDEGYTPEEEFEPNPDYFDPPEPEPAPPVHHEWVDMDHSDIPLPDSPEFNPDPAVALDQPLPVFSISDAEEEDPSAFQHPKTEPVSHMGLILGDQDRIEHVEVPSPFSFGEIIPDPVPPGMEAFPELPSRSGVVSPGSNTSESRWHTNDLPNFSLPDFTPKAESKLRLSDEIRGGDAGWSEEREDTGMIIDEDHVGEVRGVHDGEELSHERQQEPREEVREAVREEPREEIREEPKVQPRVIPMNQARAALLAQSAASAPSKDIWAASSDNRPWSEQVDDEYADELPSQPMGMRAPVSGMNNVPLGARRGGPPAPTGAPVSGYDRYPQPSPVPSFQAPAPPVQNGYGIAAQGINGYGRPYPAAESRYPQSGYQPAPARQAPQPYSPPADHSMLAHQQIPNFNYNAFDSSFNAFAPDSPLGPKPAPVRAQPSMWAEPAKPLSPITSPSPSPAPSIHSSFASPSTHSQSFQPASPVNHRSAASDISETPSSAGSSARFGSHFGGVGPGVTAPGGPRRGWADRASIGGQPAHMMPPTNYQHPAVAPAQLVIPPQIEEQGWATAILAAAPKRRGGKPINETYAEKEARKRQEQQERLNEIVASEQEGFGGW